MSFIELQFLVISVTCAIWRAEGRTLHPSPLSQLHGQMSTRSLSEWRGCLLVYFLFARDCNPPNRPLRCDTSHRLSLSALRSVSS